MMRQDPALEKDLATQQTLRTVLGRIERIEAPRSFAISPEMVAAAERSESGIYRIAEAFAPHRKLALAPAIIAGIAALSVALLTLGDIAGVVDQSEARRDESFATSAAIAESGTAGGGAVATMSPGDDSAAAVTEAELDEVVTEKADAAEAPPAPVGTPAPAETVAESALASEPAEAAMTVDSESAAAGASEPEAPSLAAEAPAELEIADSADTDMFIAPDEELARAGGSIDSLENDEATAGDGSTSLSRTADLAYDDEVVGMPSSEADGISLPLWQLQVALAALAVAAIGAWAGLRRIRGE
jgi:hypothetical protein